ncbi:hypothetical protein [Vogesella sp. LIG4]|uniref:hypothetical protein n=1 Tax=Vogesella sp. LIG4 TaxID=1192162 RepID=UPI00081FDEF1|nr:hypothetical protein [Vogesella sp. LIG4]SCK19250.1 hypothetical protein PSELUDRAFT_2103 [Vogesella sp. LIG4]
MQAVPSYDSAPPLGLPVRFFLAAWLWLLLLAASWAGTADGAYPSPGLWLPLHLMALGVLGNVMLGALLQLLAVVSALAFPRPGIWSKGLWGSWQLGCGALFAGFASGLTPGWLQLASAGFSVATLLLAGLWWQLWRSPAQDSSSRGLRWALAALLLTLGLGIAQLGVLGWGRPWSLLTLLPLHRLAAQGWVWLLLVAVAQVILPMFLLTPALPGWWQRWASPAWGSLLLLAGALSLAWPDSGWWWLAALPLPVCAWVWGGALRHSRRPQEWLPRYWQLALGLLLALCAVFVAGQWLDVPALRRLQGWLLLGGVAFTLTVGMLYRIVPFLLWLQLRRGVKPQQKVPSLQVLLPEAKARLGWKLLCLWQLCGAAWCLWPALWWLPAASGAVLAGVLFTHYRAAWLRWRQGTQPVGKVAQAG